MQRTLRIWPLLSLHQDPDWSQDSCSHWSISVLLFYLHANLDARPRLWVLYTILPRHSLTCMRRFFIAPDHRLDQYSPLILLHLLVNPLHLRFSVWYITAGQGLTDGNKRDMFKPPKSAIERCDRIHLWSKEQLGKLSVNWGFASCLLDCVYLLWFTYLVCAKANCGKRGTERDWACFAL